jgi:signal transduction histidine kinase
MSLPARVQTAVDVLAQFDIPAPRVAPLSYRLFLKVSLNTPPPLWDASPAYWIFLGFLMTVGSVLMALAGAAYVLQQSATENIVGHLFNPVAQTIGWTLIGLIVAMTISAKRDEMRRERALLNLPVWELFHAQWRPDAPIVQERANPRRYWLASLKGEPLTDRAKFFGVLAFAVLALTVPNKASSIAEVVAMVYTIICTLAITRSSNGKLMSEAQCARQVWFIQNGFWIGFLMTSLAWNHGFAVYVWPAKTSTTLPMLCLVVFFLHLTDRFRFEQSRNLAARIEKTEREKQLAEMRVQALKAQIEPHFIFNTLAHLKALIREDAKAAEAMADDLADFLRASTEALSVTRVTLAQEATLVTSYLDLMKRRMGGRLAGEVIIQSDTGGALLPPWMLLTLVENAVKHGIEPKTGAGHIEVKAALEVTDGLPRLRLTVRDDGVGFGAAQTGGSGVGLANVRERLQSLYGNAATLVLSNNSPQGVVAMIVMPYQSNTEATGALQ